MIETHLKILSDDDRSELGRYLKKKQMLRFPMQVTYDFYGSSPIHRALYAVK